MLIPITGNVLRYMAKSRVYIEMRRLDETSPRRVIIQKTSLPAIIFGHYCNNKEIGFTVNLSFINCLYNCIFRYIQMYIYIYIYIYI